MEKNTIAEQCKYHDRLKIIRRTGSLIDKTNIKYCPHCGQIWTKGIQENGKSGWIPFFIKLV